MAFKMKGNPMKRNFGVGDPTDKNKEEYKVPSPREQARLTQEYRERTGRDERYDPTRSKQDGKHIFT